MPRPRRRMARVLTDYSWRLGRWGHGESSRRCVGLRAGDREELARLTRPWSVQAGLAQRARIVLLAADGEANTAIAVKVGVSHLKISNGTVAKAWAGLASERNGPDHPSRARRNQGPTHRPQQQGRPITHTPASVRVPDQATPTSPSEDQGQGEDKARTRRGQAQLGRVPRMRGRVCWHVCHAVRSVRLGCGTGRFNPRRRALALPHRPGSMDGCDRQEDESRFLCRHQGTRVSAKGSQGQILAARP